MAKDKEYTGAKTKVYLLADTIECKVGDTQNHYGVEGTHEVLKGKGSENEKGKRVDIHILVGEVPKQLADEMVRAKRARLELPE